MTQSGIKARVKKYTGAGFIARTFVVPSALVLSYSTLLVVLFQAILIDELYVNLVFLIDIMFVSLAVLLVSGVLFAIRWLQSPTLNFELRSRTVSVTTYMMFVLLSISPVFRYIINNQDIVNFSDIAIIVISFVLMAAVPIVVIPYLLGKVVSDRLLLVVGAAFTFTLLNMATISQMFKWLEQGDIVIQLSLFAVAMVAVWLFMRMKKNDLVFFVIFFLVGTVGVQALSQGDEQTTQNRTDNSLVDLVPDLEPERTPNIYILIYDGYVPNEIMLRYGIDNSEQESYLVEQGFTMYPYNYSVGIFSLTTMNTTFNISTEYDGRLGVDGNGRAHHLFRAMDYQILGLFGTDFFFQGLDEEPNYDFYSPGTILLPTQQLLTTAILMGEFRYDISIPTMPQEEYAALKQEKFANPDNPQFTYMHTLSPGHSQNSGVCLPDETELFAERLQEANQEMTQDIETLLANDPNAVIVVAGDHGPYLTKNCNALDNFYPASEIDRLDIQDRYGAFLAIRWPSDDFSEYDEITVTQDILPAILAWMYEDRTLLDLKIPPVTIMNDRSGGVGIDNGIIVGGADDGEPLYLSRAAD